MRHRNLRAAAEQRGRDDHARQSLLCRRAHHQRRGRQGRSRSLHTNSTREIKRNRWLRAHDFPGPDRDTCACLAVPGHDTGCAPLRPTPPSTSSSRWEVLTPLSAYTLPMRCPVLTYGYDPTRMAVHP
eukprot:697257-Rhodomonas_salina.1